MKRFMLLVALILCLTVPLMFMSGCAKKEEPQPEPEPQMEQMEEAPVDTLAPDTTEVLEEVPEPE
jgi:outer membrane lipoprotein-sorting protein